MHLLLADLAQQSQVRRLAADIQANYPQLDVLINNVGYLGAERRLTADGIETTFAVNALTPLLLTELLRESLQATHGRVINLTGGMPRGPLDLDNLQSEKGFVGMASYSHAKLALMALSYEQAQRWRDSGVTLNVAYPGGAATAMTAGISPAMVRAWMRPLWPLFGLMMGYASPKRAARSSIHLASSPDVAGVTGVYFNTNSRSTAWPKPVLDAQLRAQLWRRSWQLLGDNAPPLTVNDSSGSLVAGAI